MTGLRDFQSAIFLIAPGKTGKSHKVETPEEGLAPSAIVDEVVVSLARACFSRKVAIIVPRDQVIAPLVAHVAGEYLAPREAEGPTVTESGGESPQHVPVHLVVAARTNRGRDTWEDLGCQLGLIRTGQALQAIVNDTRLLAIVAVGKGRAVRTRLGEAGKALKAVPSYSFAAGGSGPADTVAYDEQALERLDSLRRQVEWLHDPDKPDAEPAAKPRRFEFVPYALLAQQLVDKLIADHRRGPDKRRVAVRH